MTKIVQLQAENIKRLRAVNITPQGNVVIIGGENANGKSSVLDAIAMAFGGEREIPAVPVRIGEEKARVIATLDNGLIVKRTFTAAGGTALVVENKDGARFPSPQKMLDELTGKLSFDPLAFMRLEGRKQADALRRLTGLDFTDLDAKRQRAYEERTLVNRQADQARAKVATMPVHFDAPAQQVPLLDLVNELDEARRFNAGNKGIANRLQKVRLTIEASKRSIEEREQVIASLEKQLADARRAVAEIRDSIPTLEAEAVAVQAELDAFVPRDEAEIQRRIAGAETANAKVRENEARRSAEEGIAQLVAKADALTRTISETDAAKAEKLASTPFPVAGLAFTADGVTFNGIPLEQASAAEQLRVSVAIGAALNPKVRVMLVRDGSLLDDKSMALLAELAEQHKVQLWIERVGKDDACAVIIEDGTVAGEEAEPVAAAEQQGLGF